MNITRHTISLCPTCYAEIPAVITTLRDGVDITKTCTLHGSFSGQLERDPIFYEWVKNLPQQQSIYDGYFVDVTRRCNLRCETCYYPLETKDPEGIFSIPAIVNDCRVNAWRGPFILTGGDPTMHTELGKIICELKKVGRVALLTNGVKLADGAYFNEIMPLITDAGHASLNLSIHHKETDSWKQVIELCRATKTLINSALLVINDHDSFVSAIEWCKAHRDVVASFRIKAATNIWNEGDARNRVFISDMLAWLEEMDVVIPITKNHFNKSVYTGVAFYGMLLNLVSWHDVTNVDLLDINCAPWYRARNGEILNFVTASLVNEGMSKGWLKGKPCSPIE